VEKSRRGERRRGVDNGGAAEEIRAVERRGDGKRAERMTRLGGCRIH